MIRLEDVEIKKEILQDFFIWLFNDNRIIDKSITLHSEVDFSLSHDYLDSNIYYPMQFQKFFETKAMKRLGRISQLGLAINNFPNLYHSRLEHSKGVLNRKIEELFYNYQNPLWKKYIEDNNLKLNLIAELIKIAGHDIGHPPLSHAFEEQVLSSRGSHEEIGKRIMLENKEVQSLLISISPDLPGIMSELYDTDILNFKIHDESSYDVDRLDYLSRDSLYLGFNCELPTQIYQPICVESIDNKIPKYNSDYSINQSNCGNLYIDVYEFSALHEIEKSLLLRENRYKDVYMSQNTQSYEGCIKRFIEAFMVDSSSLAGIDFKNFLMHLKNSKIKDIDIDEYIEWDEIKLYSELLTIAERHENPNIRSLATMIIPNMNSFLELLYSHLNMHSKEHQFSISDKNFLKRIKSLITSNSELSNNLRNKYYTLDNTLILPEDFDFPYDKTLLTDKIIKIKSYKTNEPIYIKDASGKIFELSHHPNRSLNWENREIELHLLYTHIPYLQYKGISADEINKLKTSSLINKKDRLTLEVNMSQLKVEHSIENEFLEL